MSKKNLKYWVLMGWVAFCGLPALAVLTDIPEDESSLKLVIRIIAATLMTVTILSAAEVATKDDGTGAAPKLPRPDLPAEG